MKKNKNLIILLLVAIIGIVGVTIAYFSSRATFENVFETQDYGTTYIEKFISPDNWLPGDETEKSLEVRNSGDVDEAVRVKVEESWVSKKGTALPLTQGDNVAALINFINNDDWTKVEVDGEDYYYYYYNYKLAPEETTSKLLDKVTFNPLINATTSCTEEIEDGILTRTCNSSGAGYDGATYTLKFTIETVQYNKYQDAWNTSVNIAVSKPEPEPEPEPTPTGAEYLAENATNPSTITSYNDASADKGKMFTFFHTVNEARYIGDAPNNYVYFNCDEPQEGVEYNYASSCETWRILGVFDVDDGTGNVEQRIKLVRGSDFATTMKFDSSSNNDWTVSSLNTFLNGDYYNASGDAATYGLKASSKSMIGDAVYYLGAVSYTSSFGSTEKIYREERGTKVCGACNSDTTKLTWTGIVGLMYPSDEYMVYGNGVNNACYDNPSPCNGDNAKTGWVFNSNTVNGAINYTWLLSSFAGYSNRVLRVYSGGGLAYLYSSSDSSYGVRPVVYLSADVKITDGDGSEGDPYVLTK